MMTSELQRNLDLLEERARRMAATDSPSEVFRGLLEAAATAAPRAAVFLVRQGSLRGWGSTGYDEATAAQQRAYAAPADQGWAGQVLADDSVAIASRANGASDPDFGQEAPPESVAVPLRVKGRPIALVLLERSEPGQPWAPQGVAVLATVAQLRLDLDLARRKLAASGGTAPATAARPARAAQPAAPPTGEAAAPEEPIAVEEEPATPVAAAAEDPALGAARRYARLVATDIRLYNEDSVVQGRKHGDLAQRLQQHLARGKETFLKRHGNLGPAGLKILHQAYINVLAGGDARLVPTSVLE